MQDERFPEHPVFSGQRLREVMAAQNKDGTWLAAQTGYAPETVSRFLNGKRPIPRKFAACTAEILGIPLHWLLEETAVAHAA